MTLKPTAAGVPDLGTLLILMAMWIGKKRFGRAVFSSYFFHKRLLVLPGLG